MNTPVMGQNHGPRAARADDLDSIVKRLTELASAVADTAQHLKSTSVVRPDVPISGRELRLSRALRMQVLRDMRGKFFGDHSSMFGDPAFDILLLIYVKQLGERPVSISGACTAGNAKGTTGLRWVNNLIDKGLAVRTADDKDRRRAFLTLSDRGMRMMDRYIDAAPL